MARTQYETEKDRIRQREVADALQNVWKCTCHEMPYSYILDFIAMRGGKALAFIEVKCRKRAYEGAHSVGVALRKLLAADAYERATGLPSFFAVRFMLCGTVAYTKLEKRESIGIGIGGRTDRNDKDDVEPMIYIPISDFLCVATLNQGGE